MALARPRCGVVGVTRLNVIWVEIFSAGRVRPMGCVAEMVDPHGVHISRGGGGWRPTSSWHPLGGKHAPPLCKMTAGRVVSKIIEDGLQLLFISTQENT